MVFKDRITEWIREHYDGSPYKAQEETGVNAQQFYSWMAGKSLPNGENIKKLYDSGCDLNWLFGGGNPKLEILIKKIGEVQKRCDKIEAENNLLKSQLENIVAHIETFMKGVKKKIPDGERRDPDASV